jgi:hypothetical protein
MVSCIQRPKAEDKISKDEYILYECRQPDGTFGCGAKCTIYRTASSCPSKFPTCEWGEMQKAQWLMTKGFRPIMATYYTRWE